MSIIKDAFVSWGGTDLSSFVRSVALPYEAEETDDTAMGQNTRTQAGGLFVWTATVEFFAGEAAGEPNAVLFPDVGSRKTLIIRRDSAATASDNPDYTGTALLRQLNPVEGEVGDQQMLSAEFSAGGDLSRATS